MHTYNFKNIKFKKGILPGINNAQPDCSNLDASFVYIFQLILKNRHFMLNVGKSYGDIKFNEYNYWLFPDKFGEDNNQRDLKFKVPIMR